MCRLIKKAKRSYYGNLNPSDICDNKKFWKSIKPMFNEHTVSTENITLIENNVIIIDDSKISETFNEFFGNAVKNLNIESFKPIRETSPPDDPVEAIIWKYENHPSILKIREVMGNTQSFSFQPTNINAVMKELSSINPTKSCPIESLPSKILKEHANIFGPKILIDFNCCIRTGIFPQNLKLADITPVYKKLNKHCKTMYRPVSILSALSKIFEKLMFYQINDYMMDKFLYSYMWFSGMYEHSKLPAFHD